jgi:pyridoxal phosphate enzyme (YggS family)
MIDFTTFEQNLATLQRRIVLSCQKCSRSVESVKLLPVTKNHPLDAVDFSVRCGLDSVGENRVQEAADKRSSYPAPVFWELIGHLQSNKAQHAVATFDRIQSVDSLKLLRRLDRFSGELGKQLPILLQFNTGEDPNKYGFAACDAAQALETALSTDNLQVDGLMTIAPLDKDPEVARAAFEKLRDLRDRLAERFSLPLLELSMGMTQDLEAAIAAGSTQIRVGTALFGARTY